MNISVRTAESVAQELVEEVRASSDPEVGDLEEAAEIAHQSLDDLARAIRSVHLRRLEAGRPSDLHDLLAGVQALREVFEASS